MEEPTMAGAVKELHQDLTRKYRKHATAVEQYWHSFDRNQRAECMKVGAAERRLLKHRMDTSMGSVYKFIPEWNLREVTDPESDFLLDLLKYRATTTLTEQYRIGLDGAPGDHDFIKEMMETRNLRLIEPKDGYTFFTDDDDYYGYCVRFTKKASPSDISDTLADFAPLIQANLCVRQELGDLILHRQEYLLQALNIMIEDVLDIGSQSRDRKKVSKKPDKEAAASLALSKLAIAPRPKSLALPELIVLAQDQKSALQDHLSLLSTEPVVLAHTVNFFFFTRPELLPDEKGRSLPAHTDRFIAGAFLEAIYNAVRAVAIWDYLSRLLDLLPSAPATDKLYRTIVLQEISNVCNTEYSRTQAQFRRSVQTGTGIKWFKRISNGFDKAGNARVNMKGDPGELTRENPQLHYILRICQPETVATQAIEWVMKLAELHEAHPEERDKLVESETEALGDFIIATSFIHDLSSAVSMPQLSKKKGQLFVARMQELDAEINSFKSQIDLREFVVPIDNLLEPGVADQALHALDHAIVQKSGTKIGFLYQDVIEECLAGLQNQITHAKARAAEKVSADWISLPIPATEPQARRVEARKQKEKTRPSHSSAFEITAPREEDVRVEEEQPGPQILQVHASTMEVFNSLFDRTQARGSVAWTAFESAMADVGFSVLPKYGSVFTFLPPTSMAGARALTVHRPHASQIERPLGLYYARRLERLYGWTEKTFEVIA